MTSIKEIWLPIVGWENAYRVSNSGRIKRLKRVVEGKSWGKTTQYEIDEIIMRANLVGPDGRQYLGLILKYNGINKRYRVSRLVALAFIPNHENKPCVNHIDGNKLNNHADNLEWCTHQENTIHAFENGLMPTKITKVDAIEIRQLYATGKYKQSEVGAMFGINQSTTGKIIRNQLWQN